MRVSWHLNLVAGALVALMFVAGCGDGTDTNIDIGIGSTPTPGAHTPTPAKTATAGAKTATPAAAATPTLTSAGAATPTETSAGGATPTATTNTSNPTPTATPGGGVNADVQSITSDILPFLSGTSLLTGGSVSALTAGAALGEAAERAEALKTDPCPDGGSRVDDEGVPVRTITLNACKVSQAQLGHFQFDGTIVITLTSLSGGTIKFTFSSTDLDHNNHKVDFSGTLVLTVSGSNFVLNGPLTIMTPEGNFTVNTNQITIDSNRKLVSGSGSISDDNNNFTVATIMMTVVQGGASATFDVTFDSGPPHTYSLNLTSGELTQTS